MRRWLAPFLSVGFSAVPVSAQAVLTLGDAIDAIDETNAIASAGVRTQQAEDLRRQALALLRPTVSATATYTLRDEEIELDFGNPFLPLAPYLEAVRQVVPTLPDPSALLAPTDPQVVQYRHDVMGSVSLDQSLYNARALPFIRQARIHIRRAETEAEAVRFELRGAVTQAYFAALLQQRLIAVAERNATTARLAHERAVAAFEEDVGSRFEVNRTRVELSRAERDVENAVTGYTIARRGLAAALGRDDTDFDVVAPEALAVGAVEAPYAVEARPDVTALDLQLEASDERLAEVRGQWWPTVFAHLQGNLQRETAFGGDQFSWFLQLGANWTLYDGGVRSAQLRSRQREQALLETQREDLLVQVEAACDRLVLEIQQLERDIESASADIALAQENVELTESALELGVATGVDAQLAREQLYLAELGLAAAEVNLQARVYELRRLSGLDTPD